MAKVADRPAGMTRSKIWDWITDRLRERKRKRQAGIDDSRGTDEDESTSENQDTGSESGRIQPRPKRRRNTDKFIKPE